MWEKALIFVSPGRCGTTRIADIFNEKLPSDKFAVTHQMSLSRVANILGNMMYYTRESEIVKEKIYEFLLHKYANRKYFITSDPLTAMILPRRIINNDNVCIIQIIRDSESFSNSLFRLTRKNIKSFIAHNFIPFWQLYILPFENIFNYRLEYKYKKIAEIKNDFFYNKYSNNLYFMQMSMQEIFSTNFLSNIVSEFFGYNIDVDASELYKKVNSA